MAAFIDFSALTTDQKRLIQEMVFEKVLKNPALETVHDIYTGIKAGDRIGFIGKGGIAMKAAQACGTLTPQSGGSTGSSLLWTPHKWEILKRECGTDLEHPIMQWGLKAGNDMFDAEGTPYADAVVEVIGNMTLENMWRSIWFCDTTAALVTASPAGVITAGTDITYFTWVDGLFKLLFTAASGTPARHTTIAANAQATFALQDSVFDAAAAYAALDATERGADSRLRTDPGRLMLCTTSVMDKYILYLESKGQEPAWGLLINGGRSLKFRGIDMIEIPSWDYNIRTYQSNGTKYNYPHRIVFTTKENLKVGTQDSQLFSSIDYWHNKETRYNWMQVIGDLDCHVAETYMFQFAY